MPGKLPGLGKNNFAIFGVGEVHEIRALVKESLPAYCAPRQLVMVDAIPKTAVGKIRRNELVRDTPPA